MAAAPRLSKKRSTPEVDQFGNYKLEIGNIKHPFRDIKFYFHLKIKRKDSSWKTK